jgi:DNA polymerase-3 subunit epsilon
MREIILDTETTGFHAKGADRIIEIACLEVIHKMPTQRTFHTYINPQRDVPLAATKVHNIKTEFLFDKPLFQDIADDFLEFVGDSKIVIHNAPFDMGFLNAELARHNKATLPFEQAVDTLAMARAKFPGANNTLDGLCKRFKIDLSNRTFHGALIDCELLAEVYVELLGGRQRKLFGRETNAHSEAIVQSVAAVRQLRQPRSFPLSHEEIDSHEQFLINQIKDSLWDKAS